MFRFRRNKQDVKWFNQLSEKINAFYLIVILLPSTFYLLPSNAHAAIQWSLSVVEGYYFARLDDLNYVLKNERVELGPRNTEARPTPYPVINQGLGTEMPEMKPTRPKFGLELQADLNPQYAIVFGGSVATFDSFDRDVRPFFVGFYIPAARETRFSLLLNQFWLGAKKYWFFGKEPKTGSQEPVAPKEVESNQASGREVPDEDFDIGKKPRPRFYAEMGILAVTKAYLTTDVSLHVYAPDEGFDFYKITETEAKGNGYASYIGIGGEYFIRKWLSLGLDIDYTVGRVVKLRFSNYFTVDPLETDIIKEGEVVEYTDFIKGRKKPLFIDLEGWNVESHIRFYF